MDKLRAIQYFVAAAEEGSFAGAARRLEVSVPAVQKLLGSLERSLGVALFERGARGIKLTSSGAVYLDCCRPLLGELRAAEDTLSRSAERPSGVLTVAAHPQIAHHILMPALPRFHARYPDIQVDFRVVSRHGDADADSADVMLLHGWLEAPDFVHRRLGMERPVIVASADYWAAHGIPEHPNDLARHTCLLMRNPAGILLDLWEFERKGEQVAVAVNGWMSSNGREILLDAVMSGEGVGRFSEITTRTHLQSGRLVPVLLDWEVKGGPPINLLYRPNARRTPRARLFIDFVNQVLLELQAEEGALSQRPSAERPSWHRHGYGRASTALRSGR